MKSIIIYTSLVSVFTLTFLVGCKEQPIQEEEIQISIKEIEESLDKDENKKTDTIPQRDTLGINNKIYYLNVISKNKFLQIGRGRKTKASLNKENDQVIIGTTSLTFNFKNGSNEVFNNDDRDGWDYYRDYNFLGSYSVMDYWLIHLQLYEGESYFLLSKTDGSKIHLFGEPLFSPNKQLFVCYAADIEAGYVTNGIQLFKVKNSLALPVWEKEILKWAPDEIKWVLNSKIAIKQSYMDFNNNNFVYGNEYKTMILDQ